MVKGVQFRNHEVVGGIVELATRYRDEGADELVFYDITASPESRLFSIFRLRHKPQIEHKMIPKTRIQQMPYGVFRATDVQIHLFPIIQSLF